MEMMAAMKPSFLRLPGGNYLEGDHIRDHFAWKNTIGPLVDRPTHNGTWSYHSSDGLGLLEFLEWCEDLRIEPVLAVYAGYSLSGEHVTGEALEPFVQEALDEIEYVSGDASTKWGAVRAQNGHPAPFPLHYVEIGNEDFNDRSKSYDERFERFAKAIRARYPKLQLIATIPVHSTTPDLIDDHYYQTPEEFFSMVHHYDKADRKGPKIFVGEWATRMGSPTPNFAAALGDAAWMTSMERNSDLIVMSCYAPLLVNVNPGGMQWSSDLIGYDAMRAYGSPSYWAQVLFAHHLGNFVVKSSVDQEDSLFFSSSTVSADGKTLYLKLVNASEKPRELTLHIAGAARGSATLNTLHAATRWATNTIDDPDAIHPIPGKVELPGSVWKHTLAGNSIEVLDIPLQ
jgi:alpha-N-arabinofuranosidase